MIDPVSRGQLALALKLERHARFESYFAAANRTVVAHLEALAAARRSEPIWIHGEAGSGKSHLLQAVCAAADEAGRRAMYLALGDIDDPAALANLDGIDLLAIDQAERWSGDASFEAALFAILDAAHAGTARLVLASRSPPAAAEFELPDLASRVAGAVVYRLKPLDDEERLQALMLHARVRGLEIDAATAAYLFLRVERDMQALVAWLDVLDRESLIAQRRITVPFIRTLLESGRDEP